MEGMRSWGTLPEGCIAQILSLTSPRDACRSALVSPRFRAAAESDTVWEKFLPSDLNQIVSTAVSPVLFSSKKDLFFRLCHSPVLLDGGTLSFALDKGTGKKCYMLGARKLLIIWGDTSDYWKWTSLPESRFLEVAELLAVCWLHIQGNMELKKLSLKTTYAAYFVFKFADRCYGLEYPPVNLSVTVASGGDGAAGETNSVILKPATLTAYVQERADGWMEIKMGEFFNDQGDDGEVEMKLKEIQVLNWKSGLIVEGIELRPKEQA